MESGVRTVRRMRLVYEEHHRTQVSFPSAPSSSKYIRMLAPSIDHREMHTHQGAPDVSVSIPSHESKKLKTAHSKREETDIESTQHYEKKSPTHYR